jgi:hypothetical protein
LSQVLLDNDVVIFFNWFLAILVMIHSLASVTLDDSLTKNADSLNGNLTFTSTLLNSLKELDWVLGATTLCRIESKDRLRNEI